jgi:KipI family sensor histidine kinase inhibitor
MVAGMSEHASGAVRVRPAGRNGLLVEVAVSEATAAEAVAAWYAELCRRRANGDLSALEIVPAARTILLDSVPDPDALAAALPTWPPPPPAPEQPDALVTVPTVYDGPDLADVAARWGMSTQQAIETHTSIEFRVAFCGFAPGFAYLTGLPPQLRVPRHPTPRTRVPAGSVAIADEYTAVYPTASPGGWRLLGRTDLVLFDLDADPPATLVPGARVRFAASA